VRRLKRRSAAALFPLPHEDVRSAEILARLRGDAERIAAHFDLSYVAIFPERANVKSRYGVCYADGRIAVRLRHARSGRSLKYSSLINTLCHELAHLRYFNHGPRFRGFYRRILEFARDAGIYQPEKTRPPAGVQLDLFKRQGSAAGDLCG
jgi:predicted metal-dependent hydrolase